MKLSLISAFICLLSLQVRAQQDSSKKTTLTLAALYSSNVSYYGQVTNEKLPYVLVNATLRFPVGVHLSAGAYKLLNYGSGISETDLGFGYDYDFNDKWTAGIAYSRSFFPENSPLLQASNENNINLSTTYLWPWFKTDFSADYAFGKQSDAFLSLSNSKEISIGTLFNGKNALYIEPAIELIAGTTHFYETYAIEKNKRDQAKGKGKPAAPPGKPGTGETTTMATNSFNLLSYNFKLPLSLSRANYIAEISYQLSVPGAAATAELKHPQSFFGLAFYYQF